MPTKTISFQPAPGSPTHGRTFEIRVKSDLSGYVAEVAELRADGATVAIDLPHGPRLEISPSTFYRMREHHRGYFLAELESALRDGPVVRLDGATSAPTFHVRANLLGWPDGYPEAVDDDMAAWIDDVACSVQPDGAGASR